MALQIMVKCCYIGRATDGRCEHQAGVALPHHDDRDPEVHAVQGS